MEKKFPSWWLSNSWQSVLLTPLALLVKGALTANKYYQKKWASPYKSNIPIIIVGNIMVGGTGKTPMVIHLASLCKKAGLNPAIVSKGYGGTYVALNKNTLLVTANHNPQEVGDEPLMMACANVAPVIISYRRSQSVKWIAQNLPEINCIICDDGLHDYSLEHDIEIAMVDGMRGLGNEKIIPAGPLRESKKRLKTVNYTIISAPHTHLSKKIKYDAIMTLQGDIAINMLTQEKQPLSSFANIKPLAIAGIGNPQRFFKHLKRFIPNLDTKSFGDHYDYTQGEELPVNQCLLMTSKDAIKFRDVVADNYWEVPVTAVLSDAFNQNIIDNVTHIKK
jgi:tetraacyldisaccharide 4'-kinase